MPNPILPIVRMLEADEAGHGPFAHVEIAHRHQPVAIVDAHFARVEDRPVETARQILVQGGVDESLEAVLVQGIKASFSASGLAVPMLKVKRRSHRATACAGSS